MKAKTILIALALKYGGNWDDMFKAIQNKETEFPPELIEAAENQQAITILDDNYPQELKQVLKPPFVLFYKGNINLLNDYRHKITVVGTRKEIANCIAPIAEKIKETEFIIVSGMTRGTQEGLLDNCLYRNVIGVLPCGINKYTTGMSGECDNVANNGLLISEYPNKTDETKISCVLRNRIIAALSNSVIAVNLVNPTISWALGMGKKEIYAVPEPFKKNEVNSLIIDGATPLVDLKQIDDFGR